MGFSCGSRAKKAHRAGRMKRKLSVGLLIVMTVILGCLGGVEQPQRFAQELQEIILSGDVDAFEDICTATFPDQPDFIEDLVRYVFGDVTAQFSIRSFMLDQDLEIYVGPFGSGEDGVKRWLVIYYDPAVIDFSTKVSPTQLEEHWQTGYVETVVECTDGVCVFPDTAFQYATSPTWVGDY